MRGLEERAEEALAQERRLVKVDLSTAIDAALLAPQYVIPPLVPSGVPTLLSAHGGAGKSTLGEIWVAHTAAGGSWAGLVVEFGKAVFVSLEDPAHLVLYRLRRIVEAYGLNWADVLANVHIFDGTDADAALVTEVNDHGVRSLVPTQAMRELEEAVQNVDTKKTAAKTKTKVKKRDPYIEEIEETLRVNFQTTVRIKPNKDKGHIELSYFGKSDLERLLELLKALA